jgi:hypothetical protein
MEVRIGVVQAARELVLEIETPVTDFEKQVDEVLKDENAVLWVTDKKGARTGIRSARIAYVEITKDDDAKQVGFGRG